MSKNNRITYAKAQKLRSGHTYWRCQIQQDGTVYISEESLKGSKFTSVMRSVFPEDVPESKRRVLSTSLVIGPKSKDKWTRRSYLSSVNTGSSINTFRTRRAALRWKREVEVGLHPEAVSDAMDHWQFCDDLPWGCDYDDGPYNGIVHEEEDEPPQMAYTEPMTLGQLLRKKLEEKNPYEGNDDAFVGTDVKPLFELSEPLPGFDGLELRILAMNRPPLAGMTVYR